MNITAAAVSAPGSSLPIRWSTLLSPLFYLSERSLLLDAIFESEIDPLCTTN
jgi:hypothetical protein